MKMTHYVKLVRDQKEGGEGTNIFKEKSKKADNSIVSQSKGDIINC